MKSRILILAVLIITTLTSTQCEKEDCGECFTPPDAFSFEIVDKDSGENLFTNGTFSQGDIRVTNLDDQSNVTYKFIDEDDYNVLVITTIGWKTEKVNYSISIAGNKILDLYVDAERIDGDCCSYTEYNEIKISNAEFESKDEFGFYRILIP